MTNIKYHPDVRGYAVNVKTHGMRFAEGGTEVQRELAWDSTHEDWWNYANEIARQEGFGGAAACGRSCGWCAPFYFRDGRYSYVKWTVDEGDDPDYDAEEAERFAKFADRIEAHLKDVPAMYKENLERIIEEDAETDRQNRADADKRERMKVAALGILQGVNGDVADYWRKQWGMPE